jgi:hypothetical protein
VNASHACHLFTVSKIAAASSQVALGSAGNLIKIPPRFVGEYNLPGLVYDAHPGIERMQDVLGEQFGVVQLLGSLGDAIFE